MLEIILEESKRKGVTQTALERLAGLSANRIAKWKAGQGEPSFSEAVRIARALGVSLNRLADMPDDVPRMTDEERALWMVVKSIGPSDALRRLTAPLLALPTQPRETGSNATK